MIINDNHPCQFWVIIKLGGNLGTNKLRDPASTKSRSYQDEIEILIPPSAHLATGPPDQQIHQPSKTQGKTQGARVGGARGFEHPDPNSDASVSVNLLLEAALTFGKNGEGKHA